MTPIDPSTVPAGPVVYLLHLHRPLRHARHYVGWTCDLRRRMTVHERGLADSCAFLKACLRDGIGWDLVRVWTCDTREEAWALEKRIKQSASSSWNCPVCRDRQRARARLSMRRSRARRKAALDNGA